MPAWTGREKGQAVASDGPLDRSHRRSIAEEMVDVTRLKAVSWSWSDDDRSASHRTAREGIEHAPLPASP